MKYERLTKYNEYTHNAEVYAFTVGNEDVYFDGIDIVGNENSSLAQETIDKLAELEDKIENGTLVELPCKVGDTVWYIKVDGEVIWVDEMVVKGFEFSKCNEVIFIVGTYREKAGKIYKTKAEAEKKLKELKGK